MPDRLKGLKAGLACLALLGLLAGVAYAALCDLAPASNAIPDWKALNADKNAAGPDELHKIYNGGDGVWKTAGVTAAFQRHYKNEATGKIATLIINKTGGDWKKAKALYTSKNESFTGQPGYQALELKAAGAVSAVGRGTRGHMWGKYYYCTIEVNGTSAAEVTAAKKFLQKLSATITEKG